MFQLQALAILEKLTLRVQSSVSVILVAFLSHASVHFNFQHVFWLNLEFQITV